MIINKTRAALTLAEQITDKRPGWWLFEMVWNQEHEGYRLRFTYHNRYRYWLTLEPEYATLDDALHLIDSLSKPGDS